MYSEVLQRLSRALYPRGRAFKMPYATNDSPPSGGFLARLHKALSLSENRAFSAALGVLDSAIPDNPNFDADDATNWERALGIYSAVGTTLPDRILAIKTKMNFPGTTAARQHYSFIEDELQAAGFNVFVYENRFLTGSPPAYTTKTPTEVYGSAIGEASLGNFNLGETNLGSSWADDGVSIIANYIEESKDAAFGFGNNLRSTFYVSAPFVAGFASFADVTAVRKDEFRQLLLQLKPVQSVGILFIEYTV